MRIIVTPHIFIATVSELPHCNGMHETSYGYHFMCSLSRVGNMQGLSFGYPKSPGLPSCLKTSSDFPSRSISPSTRETTTSLSLSRCVSRLRAISGQSRPISNGCCPLARLGLGFSKWDRGVRCFGHGERRESKQTKFELTMREEKRKRRSLLKQMMPGTGQDRT